MTSKKKSKGADIWGIISTAFIVIVGGAIGVFLMMKSFSPGAVHQNQFERVKIFIFDFAEKIKLAPWEAPEPEFSRYIKNTFSDLASIKVKNLLLKRENFLPQPGTAVKPSDIEIVDIKQKSSNTFWVTVRYYFEANQKKTGYYPADFIVLGENDNFFVENIFLGEFVRVSK